VIGVRSRLEANVTLGDTIMIGADSYETDAERERNRALGIPNVGIGEGSLIERAIIDKDCRIGRNVRIVNRRGLVEDEGDNYCIREGIVCIPKGASVADNSVI
jgi:glucose-1-phosphate adenylyltransferase